MASTATISSASASKDYSRIRLLTKADVQKAAVTLFHSFKTDSLAKLLTVHISDPQHRELVDYTIYECYLKQHMEKGLCIGIGETDDKFETVAIWSTPSSHGDGLDSFANLMEAGYHKLWDISGEEGRHKIFKGMLPLLHDTSVRILSTDTRFMDKDCFTLVYLGSVAEARGKGNVRLMFDYMFEKYIDLPGTSHITYLESSSPDNIPIYNRFGFHFLENIMLGSQDKSDAKEGYDYAVMNVMIRGPFGKDWTGDSPSGAKL